MQSQQKKVKWSRGETADALEERTDTGITQVSVSKLENIIADIYGNISRRPAFKIISKGSDTTDLPIISGTGGTAGTEFVHAPQSFLFTVDANTYIIFIADEIIGAFGGLLVQNGKFIKKVTITYDSLTLGSPLVWDNKHPISTAQYNNYMIVSHLFLKDVIFRLTATNDITVEEFKFAAPWYAPGGSQTKTVSADDLPGLEFNNDGKGFTAFAWTDNSGNSSPYSLIDTGLNGSTQSIEEAIPVGSIVRFPNLGAYMRVEGYQSGGQTVYFPQYTFDSYGNINTPIPSSGWFIQMAGAHIGDSKYVTFRAYHNGTLIEEIRASYNYHYEYWFQSSTAASGFIKITPQGGWPWTEVPAGSLDVQMFGPLLTPVANESGKDKTVTVEYGYISLNEYQPTSFTFSNQRLFAASFENYDLSPKQIPGYAVGSQITRFNDFKNDYNTASEAVVIDISTQYQEQIMYLVDYNGLKIFTDSAEYLYNQQNGVVKQSENGALSTCRPIVFGSVCLYADKTGNQIRALQYELQTDLFTSSSINQMAKEDLIFNTTSLSGFLDKEHCNGRFLYATQNKYTLQDYEWKNPVATHSIAVCNMVPGNQAMIWSRWTSPEIKTTSGYDRHSIANTIEVCNKTWFILACQEVVPALDVNWYGYTLAELDYDNELDIETESQASDIQYQPIPANRPFDMIAWVDQNDPTNIVYTHSSIMSQGDPIYDADDNQISVADNNPGGPNIIIDGVGYYAWQVGGSTFYTKDEEPNPTGTMIAPFDESRRLYDSGGNQYTDHYIGSYVVIAGVPQIIIYPYPTPSIVVPWWAERVPVSSLEYTINDVQYTADTDPTKNINVHYGTIPRATVSVFDGDEYKWDDTLDANGNYTKPLTDLEHPRVGFMINAELVSHPIDVGGKTYTDHKRIGKCVAVVRDTEPGAFTVCDKTGYMDNNNKTVNFYGCTGMKNELRYTIKNIQGAKFTIESLTMIIEYATLDS